MAKRKKAKKSRMTNICERKETLSWDMVISGSSESILYSLNDVLLIFSETLKNQNETEVSNEIDTLLDLISTKI